MDISIEDDEERLNDIYTPKEGYQGGYLLDSNGEKILDSDGNGIITRVSVVRRSRFSEIAIEADGSSEVEIT